MIINKVFRLLKNVTLDNGIKLSESQEFEVVMNVVYMEGYPVPPNMQQFMLKWILSNPNLFADVTKKW